MATAPKMNVKTIVQVDLENFTPIARWLQEQLDAEAVHRLENQIQTFVESGLNTIGAERAFSVLRPTGDGAVLAFDRAVDSITFAVAMHRDAERHSLGKRLDSQRWFRIGIATGDVYLNTDGFSPDNVSGNVRIDAARLESAAQGGQILADIPTFKLLPADLQLLFDREEIVTGKHREVFAAHRYTVVKRPASASPVINPVLKLTHPDVIILVDALSDTPQFVTVTPRRAIILKALTNTELNKALQYIRWDEAPAVFAFELVEALNGRIAAPGVPALALIAHAILPLTGVDHQEKLADLIRRMGWG